jgi:hypothetical protein
MKKLIYIGLMALGLLGCEKEGEIDKVGGKLVQINGKNYRFIRIVPADNYRAVWLLVPQDTSQSLPQTVNYEVNSGKTTKSESVIIIP